MAEAALRRMSVEEFLQWNGEPDARHQLFDGVPVSMAPAGRAHGLVAATLARLIGNALERRPPCTVQTEAGIVPINRQRSYYEADVVVTCRPHRPGEFEVADPVLIVEVLSPSTERDDRSIKVPDYQLMPTVEEILLLYPDRPYCEVVRRREDGTWSVVIVRDLAASVRLASIDLDLPMADIYANVSMRV